MRGALSRRERNANWIEKYCVRWERGLGAVHQAPGQRVNGVGSLAARAVSFPWRRLRSSLKSVTTSVVFGRKARP
jgi:hypothetical protein